MDYWTAGSSCVLPWPVVRCWRPRAYPSPSRFETSKYTDQMPDGLSLQYSLLMDCKSVITRPSNAMKLPQKGIYEVTDIAWSGAGKITKVEVSADGGKTWAEAELQEPVQSKADPFPHSLAVAGCAGEPAKPRLR